MTNLDLSPLLRSMIGFDRMMRLVDTAPRSEDTAYPPYNIEKTGEDSYRITMALAGFSENDITITVQENTLIVTGKMAPSEKEVEYLYRGIAGRAFERRFQLADFIKIGNATLENGLLFIELIREIPEVMKPRTIAIKSKSPQAKLTSSSKAAASA